MITQELKEQLCLIDMPNQESERFITREEAIRRFDCREGAAPGNADVSGFYFTLKILETFIARINEYNTNVTETSEEIAGIRIWQAKSYAHDSHILIEDVVITPTKADGSDIHAYEAGEILTGPKAPGQVNKPLLILSSSRPCPNLCGVPGPKFFHLYRP